MLSKYIRMVELNQEEIESTSSTKNEYKIIPYISNYYNIIEILKQIDYDLEEDEISKIHASLKIENEILLKDYYHESTLQLPKYSQDKKSTIKESHVKKTCGIDILEKLLANNNAPINNLNYYDKKLTGIHSNMVSLASTSAYLRYYEKVELTAMSGWDIVKNHLLWIPSFHTQFRDILLYNKRNEKYDPNKKTSLMTIDGENYIPKQFDSYYGASSIPSTFGAAKLPNLVYHCSISTDEQMYILGGMFPCYKYDEEFPNLDSFVVEGIPNLPPPFLPKVVNHPAFIGNPFLFAVNPLTSTVRIHKLDGDIPPPTIGMTASLLTDRYIFYYGGVEIKTDSSFCKKTKKVIVKKRFYFNEMGYILDTIRLRFTKIKLGPVHSKTEQISLMYPRFGHLQVSVKKEGDNISESPLHFRHMHTESDSLQKDHHYKYHDLKDYDTTSSTECHGSIGSTNESTKTVFETNQSYSFSVTVYIFGGYKQDNNSRFQALNDMWKIHIPIHHIGKNGLCIFGETAFPTCLNTSTSDTNLYPVSDTALLIPSERAFMSYCVYNDIPGSNYSNFEIDLLENLRRNFKISLSESTMKKVLHTSNRNSLHSNRSSDGSPKLPCRDYYTNITHASNVPHRTLIMHGGSNNLEVLGDMWWFDMETEKWQKVDTYASPKHEEGQPCQEAPLLNMKLVGHSMSNIGSVVSMGGGMMQSDVDTLYDVQPEYRHKDYEKALLEGVPIGSRIFRTIDIRTQFIINRTVSFCSWDKERTIPLTSTNPKDSHGLMLIVGSTVCKSGGRYIMVGGITSRRSNLKDFYLRGTLLNITVPAVTLYV